MENDTTGQGQPQMTDEELGKINLDEIDPDSATPEQVELLKKGFQTSLAQKGHWRNKYDRDAINPETGKPWKDSAKAPEKPDPHKPNTPPAESEDVSKLKADVDSLKLSDQKRHVQHRLNLSPEETDLLVRHAGGDLGKVDEVYKDEFFQAGLKAMRDKQKISDNTPRSSHRITTVEGKKFEDMTPAEQKKHWPKVTGASQ